MRNACEEFINDLLILKGFQSIVINIFFWFRPFFFMKLLASGNGNNMRKVNQASFEITHNAGLISV